MALACRDLQQFMRAKQAPSGILMLERNLKQPLTSAWSPHDFHDWADHGVSVMEVETDDLMATAAHYLHAFADRRHVMRARFFNSMPAD
jgi:hypothetical protein